MSSYLRISFLLANCVLLLILLISPSPVVGEDYKNVTGGSSNLTREAKDLEFQSLEKEAEAWTKPPAWITINTLLEHPEWIFNNTEEDFQSKVLGVTDLFSGCLENWEAPRILQETFPYYHAGYDDENRAVWIAEAGKYNVRKIVEEGGPNLEALEVYMRQAGYRIMKSIMNKLSQENRNIEVRFLIDFDGLNIAQLIHLPTVTYGLKYTRRFSRIMANHVGPSVIINANYATETALNFARPILPTVLGKVEIYGTNKDKWLPRLRRHFPKEILPEWYGGTKTFRPIDVFG